MNRGITVLVVDDSAVVRQVFRALLEAEGDIRVIAMAQDPFEAVKCLAIQVPDVMIVDVEMPRMDGITFLRKVMGQHPIATIVCSSLTALGSGKAFEASRAGAVEVLEKPAGFAKDESFADQLREAVRVAKTARVRTPVLVGSMPDKLQPAASKSAIRAANVVRAPNGRDPAEAPRPIPVRPAGPIKRPKLIAIGASTGGTEAIRRVLAPMHDKMPPIVIVQHMPAGFTTSFASWLDDCCRVSVSEATDGQFVTTGQAIVARGGAHLRVRVRATGISVMLGDDPPVNRHRPSVDALFDSVSSEVGGRALGLLLTGMGDDGARGLLRMRQSGATTIAESESSAVVFGMPKEAIARGAAELVLGLDDINAYFNSVPMDEVL
ncbi:MAG: chemotaxis-specific protein-glutamate methyltransferase CheB [Polyangiaceae bacterium]